MPIDDLRGLSASLNKASDELNKILKSTEEELRALNLGVEAWIKAPIEVSDSVKVRQETCYKAKYLGWTKIDSFWCLALKTLYIREGLFEGDQSCPYVNKELIGIEPVLGKGRDIRAKAVASLEDLFFAIRYEAEKVLDAVDKSVKLNLTLGGKHA